MRNMLGTLMLAGAAAMISLPVVAAPPPPPPPQVQFGLHFGTTSPGPNFYDPYDDDDCLTTRQIIREVRSDGYRSVRVLYDNGDVLTLRARLGYKTYVLKVDDCSGEVLSRRRV